MRWRKLGAIFQPGGEQPWMRSHASNPVAEHRGGELFRIYFGSRDRDNRSSIGWVEIDLRRPGQVLRLSERPAVAPGPAGAFDDSGASMGCLVPRPDGSRFLYYVGWNLGVTVPWRNSIGLAVSAGADAAFEKVSRAPVLDRSEADPYSLSYPWVIVEGESWTMWYGSNLTWGPAQDDMAHVIKRAQSRAGIAWQRDGAVALGLSGQGEIAVSRPCVLRERGRWLMWYSYRGRSYRVGYAESSDGMRWQRMDREAGIEPSPSGWDSESVAYAHVFDHAGRRYMLYNGDGYGRTGFGLAVQEAA
jgi:hypothetical protein